MYLVFILPERSHEQIRNAGHAFGHLATYCRAQQTLASMPVYQSYEDAELAGLYNNGKLRVPNTICVCKINGSLSDLESCKIEQMTLIGQESSTRSVIPFRLDKSLTMSLLLTEDPNFDAYWSKPTSSFTSISSRERLKQLLSSTEAPLSSDTNRMATEQQVLSFRMGNVISEQAQLSGEKEEEKPSNSKTGKFKA